MIQYFKSIEKIADHYGYEKQKNKTIEELIELADAIIHDQEDNIIEEIADVLIMLNQIIYLKEISEDVDDVIKKKTARQIVRMRSKPKFRLEDYPENYVMHCDTLEKAEIFCRYLHNLNREWIDGSSYKDETNWEKYKKDTVYDFNIGMYADKEYAEDEGYTILEFDDFDWEEKR